MNTQQPQSQQSARQRPYARNHAKMLCEGAVLVAISQILSYIKLLQLPNGGSLTVAMFPVLLFAVRWGLVPGITAGVAFGLLQMMFDGAYAWGWQSILLDYLLAFGALGFAGLFRKKNWSIFAGIILGCAARFGVHYISGVTIYRILVPTEVLGTAYTSPTLYSLVYNGVYMLPNTLLALGIAALLYRPMRMYFLGEDI